mgnify:CR=1 FL=1
MDKDEVKTLEQIIELLGGLIDSVDSRDLVLELVPMYTRLNRSLEFWSVNSYELT